MDWGIRLKPNGLKGQEDAEVDDKKDEGQEREKVKSRRGQKEEKMVSDIFGGGNGNDAVNCNEKNWSINSGKEGV